MLGVEEPMTWERSGSGFIIHVPGVGARASALRPRLDVAIHRGVTMRRPCRWFGFLFGASVLLGGFVLSGVVPAPASAVIELVRDGRSDYSIRVDTQASPVTLAAADTLQRYMRAISGRCCP